jgi:hypothetical protein
MGDAKFDMQLEFEFLLRDDVPRARRLHEAAIEQLPLRLILAVAANPAVEARSVEQDSRTFWRRHALHVLGIVLLDELEIRGKFAVRPLAGDGEGDHQ